MTCILHSEEEMRGSAYSNAMVIYLIAERIQISASVYPYIYTTYVRLPKSVSHASPAPGGKARVQNGASTEIKILCLSDTLRHLCTVGPNRVL